MAAAAPIKVAILGATGRTGGSIVDGLLASKTKYEITAITRPSSLESADIQELRAKKGTDGATVRIVALDLHTAPEAELTAAFAGLDVVVSAVSFKALGDQLRLLGPLKAAGVKRFVPCFYGTAAPRGAMHLLDSKLDILAAIQREYIPYTAIDVGWWTQAVVPKLPSGRTDATVLELVRMFNSDLFYVIPGDGNVPTALTDIRDIGVYVAAILADPRTLNKLVLAYTEVLTFNQAYDLMEEVSGEKTIRVYKPAEKIRSEMASAKEALAKDPTDATARLMLFGNQYLDSWGLRGHNTPEYAKYVGYLDVKELYPDLTGQWPLRRLFEDVLAGNPAGIKPIK